MSIAKAEVFECTICGLLSKDDKSILECIKKHKKDDLQDKEYNTYKNLQNTVVKFMVTNLKSLNKNDVRDQLIAVFRLMGINLDVYSLESSEIYLDSLRKKECATYKITGSLHRISNTEIKSLSVITNVEHENIFLPKRLAGSFNYSFEKLLEKKRDPCFSDLCEISEGLDPRSGGGKAESFHYGFALYIDDFPEINKKWKKLKELRDKSKSYIAEKKKLEKQYEDIRKPSLLISDIEYQQIKSDFDDLSSQITLLNKKVSEVSIKMKSRVSYLVSKDSASYTTPDSSFEFDYDLEEQLTRELCV